MTEPERAPAERTEEQAPADATAAVRTRGVREDRGELISAMSAFVLLVLMFAFAWYGTAGVPGRSVQAAGSGSETGWEGLHVIRWVVLATAVLALGTAVLHRTQRGHGTRTDASTAITLLGALTSVLLGYRVLIALPSSSTVVDQKLGAVLGLLCALGIAFGGFETMRAERARARRAAQRTRRQRHGARPGGSVP